MRKVISFLVLIIPVLCLFAPLEASAKDRKKVKVSVLLKETNEIMDEAQNTYVDGDATKAIELYRKALVELIKIEGQYPDRVTSADFAPLRFRRALCETEVDRIMLEEVNASARSIAVTDTRELEQKRRERREEAATNKFAKVSRKLTTKGGTGMEAERRAVDDLKLESKKSTTKKPVHKKTATKEVDIAEELEWAKDMFSVDKFDEVERSLIMVLRKQPDNFDARYLMTLTRIRQNKLVDSKIILEDLLDDYGRHEGVLLLAAGLYAMQQEYAKAMATLDKALKVAPKRPEGYFNMAWLLLEMNPKQLSDPEMYYRRAVELGGKRDSELEKRLGIRQN